MDEFCYSALNGKQLNFSDDLYEHSSCKEICFADQLDLSAARGGVNDSSEESLFMLNRFPPMKQKDSTRNVNFHMEALTPILKNMSPNETSFEVPCTSVTRGMDNESMDVFPMKCSDLLRHKLPDSPIQSPGPFYFSKSRLQSLTRHSSRTTSTPCNTAFNGKVQMRLNKVFDENEDGMESSRRKLFNGKNEDESSMMEVEGGNEGAETSSTGLSWKEGMSNLIGDMSAPFRLPLHHSKHQDLKAISSKTMADLLNGKYDKTLERFVVVDCRYPYEFEGGHIKGALNIFSQDCLLQQFFSSTNDEDVVIIFHCEFSSERGPKMMRFLRNHDRDVNQYPILCYPEMYLLEGGYSSFFPLHPDLCDPSDYIPMLHPDHLQDLRDFQSKKRVVQEEMAKNAFMLKFHASPNDLNNSDL